MKVNIRYSKIYDEVWKMFAKRKKNPPEKKLEKYSKDLEKLWKKDEKLVLDNLSRIMKLKWKEKEIVCYVVWRGLSFSDPLTVKIKKDKQLSIDTLIHELIHQMQRQNSQTMKKWWAYALKKYKREKRKALNHILLDAVFETLYLRIFNKRRLNRNRRKYEEAPDYKRAWEIVEEEGAENILKKFLELTK